MATRTWLNDNPGTTDNAWSTAANWSGTTVPADGDTVIINRGTRSITSGLDQTGIDLASLYVGPGFTGDIGTIQSSPLIIGCSAGLVKIESGGSKVFISADGSGSPIAILRMHLVRIGSGGSNGTLYLCGGTITSFIMNRGQVQAYSGTITTAKIRGASYDTNGNFQQVSRSECNLDILNATVTTLEGAYGQAEMLEDGTGTITTARLSDFPLTVFGGATLGTCYNYLQTNKVIHAATTNVTLIVNFGIVDFSAETTARTVSTLEAHAGSKHNLSIGTGEVTVTSLVDLGGQQFFGPPPDTSGV